MPISRTIRLLAAFAAVSAAQNTPQAAWIASTTTKVKPEMRQEFEGYLQRIVAAHRTAGVPWFVSLQTLAGDTTEYTTIVPLVKFGDLDSPSLLSNVLGAEAWDKLSHKIANCYTAQTRQYAMRQTGLDIGMPETASAGYWVETRALVAPGKIEDYLNWLKDYFRPALIKTGASHFMVSRPLFGAAAGEIVSARLIANLAEIDSGPLLTRVFGADGAKIANEALVALIHSSDTRICRVRRDLSYSR